MGEIVFHHVGLLDHGYVKLIEAWGTGKDGKETDHQHLGRKPADYEVGIVEAARQSTQGDFRGWVQDAKLVHHLYRNRHETPFEFSGAVFEVQAPLMVFREWHRHRTQSYNEMSARYAPLPELYYVPDLTNLLERANTATTNKQAAGIGNEPLIEEDACDWLLDLSRAYEFAEKVYQQGLKMGVPKELARLVMPVGHYSRMRAAANLRNWLSFMRLRLSTNAMWEIRIYAEAVFSILRTVFPQTIDLFARERSGSL